MKVEEDCIGYLGNRCYCEDGFPCIEIIITLDMPIRAILFDLDGTLIDQFQAIHKAFAITLERMGFPKPSFEEVKKAVGGASQSTMEKLIGVKRAKEAVKILRPIFEKEMLSGLFALPGAYDILKDCKSRKIKTAVLTNKYGPHARAVCSHLKFDQYLEFTIGADDTVWKKPNLKLTKFALNKLGVNKEETVYVGDSPYDYQTAKNSSMRCILVPTGTHDRNELLALGNNVFIENSLTSILDHQYCQLI